MEDIVLLHGAIGSKAQLAELKAVLSETFRVHDLNFSGHGGAAFQSQFNIPQFAKELEEFLRMKNLTRANVFGYSMGGYVALYLAKHYPGSLGKIMTLGTKFKWSAEIAAKEVRMMNADVIEAKIPKFAAVLEHRHQPLNWKDVMQKTADMMHAMGQENVLSLGDYQAIEIPVKIGLADQDEMVTREETMEVVNELPVVEFYDLTASNHPIEKVNLKQLSNEITSFFS